MSVRRARRFALSQPTPSRFALSRVGPTPYRRTNEFRKNTTFAGRSASRRMKYGYHSCPKGT